MKLFSRVGTVVVLMLLAAGPARAATILDVSGALTAADPTQLGRLSRNGILQDWVGTEPFPGVLNTTTLYHYHAYVVNVGTTPYVQVNFDSISVNTFVAAYDTAYLPNSAGAPNFGFDTNWLGDAGASGNFFGTDPVFFQVLVPLNHNLLIIVSNTGAANLGVGDPFHLIVEGFIDSAYTEPTVVPEPATLLLGGLGLAAAGLRRRMKR
jgi:PEP-CTERM motif